MVFIEAQGHPWSFSFAPTPYVVCPISSLPWPPTFLPSLQVLPQRPPCYSWNMPNAPAFAPLQWLSHLPEHSSSDVPMTNSFTSCKPLHKDHSLSGAGPWPSLFKIAISPPTGKFYALLPCSMFPFFPVHSSPSTYMTLAYFSIFITLLYFTYYLLYYYLIIFPVYWLFPLL